MIQIGDKLYKYVLIVVYQIIPISHFEYDSTGITSIIDGWKVEQNQQCVLMEIQP